MGQQKKLTRDMTERHAKMTLVNDIIHTGNMTRIATFKSQALREPKMIEDAVKNFEKMDRMFAELGTITRLAADIERIDESVTAANTYKNAMTDFLKNWLELQELGTKRGQAGGEVIEATKIMASAGLEATDKIAGDAAASTIMVAGLMIALLAGVSVAFIITRGITKPVNRIIEGLKQASDQVASATGQFSSSSQQLAEGFQFFPDKLLLL